MPDSSLFIEKNNRTLGDEVTRRLREEILSGRLAPGTPLGQEKLAGQFGVSRVPIREALRVLAGENLVQLESYRGAVVTRLSIEELDELYGIIWGIEIPVVRRAVPAISDEALAEMREIVSQMRTMQRDAAGWYRLNVRFHRVLMEQSGWSYAVRIVDDCRRNIGRYATAPSLFEENVDVWTERDARLLDACERRDPAAAIAALEEMQNRSIPTIRDYLARRETNGSKVQFDGRL